MEESFDVVVVGAGPAGEVAAGRLAQRGGLRVALVERHLVGGECSFYACMPSKALLRPGDLLAETGRVPGVDARGLDVPAVLKRRDEVVHGLDDAGQLPWLDERGVVLVRGEGRLDGERCVRVGDRILQAREAVVLATGSEALIPPIPGLREAEPQTSRELTVSSAVPEHLIVLGGGVVGVEMAQAWRSLGARVTVVEALDRVLAHEEPFAGELVARALAEDGVDVRTGTRAEQVARRDGRTELRLDDGSTVTGDRLLVAIGRRPATADLGLETVGLEPGRPVEVDDTLRVPGRPWLYAVGDVNGRALLTHMGKYQARLAADAILGAPVAVRLDAERSSRVVFTDPQVAAVGHTLQTARNAGIAARAIDTDPGATAGASFHGRGAPAQARLVLDTDRDVVAGATFVAPDVADFVQAATIAIVGQVPLTALVHAIAPFPTRSEVWLNALEAAGR